MARKQEFTYERVVSTIMQLRHEGIKITVRNVRDRMGGGDPARVCEYVAKFIDEEIQAQKLEISVTEDLIHKIQTEIAENVILASDGDRKQIAAITDRCVEMQEMLIQNQQELVSLLAENESLRARSAEIEQKYQTEVFGLTERLSFVDSGLRDAHSANGALEKEIDGLRVTSALAAEDANRYKQQAERAASANTDLAEENNKLKAVNSGLDKDLAVARAEATMLKETISKLETALQDSASRADKTQQALQQEIKGLRSNLNNASADIARRMETQARTEAKLVETEKSNGILEERLRNLSVPTSVAPVPPV